MATHDDGLPFAPASERNKGPILTVLRDVFSTPATVLEIGAGTGQHAVHFAAQLPHLRWLASDAPGNSELLGRRLAAAELSNLQGPLTLDVRDAHWPVTRADGVYAANVAHIMDWGAVQALFAGVGQLLAPGGAFCLYGPFNIDGRYTSDSNAAFDADLRARGAGMGLRDVAALQTLAAEHGLSLAAEHAMPANNQILVWRKHGAQESAP